MNADQKKPDVKVPTAEQLDTRGRRLVEVLELAAALPTKHKSTLRYPPLKRSMVRNKRDGADPPGRAG